MIRATVKGNVLVAVIQGTLGGLAFWVLGVHAPVLWGVVMAFLSLLPAIGAALIWGPVAIYLLATGAIWKGVALIAFGVLVIGLIDNVLRPILVGKETKLPDYVVLVSTLGGLAIFGLNGFVLGPVIVAMFIVRLRGHPGDQPRRAARSGGVVAADARSLDVHPRRNRRPPTAHRRLFPSQRGGRRANVAS